MQITFCAYGDLRRYTPQNQERLPLGLSQPTSVAALLVQMGVPSREVGTVAINGKVVDENYVVADGDKVEIFSPVGGGS